MTCHGIQVFKTKIASGELSSTYGWEKMRGVSDGSEVFQNGERKSQTFRLRIKHGKPALATDQHVTVQERTPKSSPETALNHFSRRQSLEPIENSCHLM